MSTRRHLASRARHGDDNSSSLQDAESSASVATTALPPYEPPSCPLSASGKRALDDLRVNHDYSKYTKHLKAATTTVSLCAVESNDRLFARKEKLQKAVDKKRQQGREDEEKTEAEAKEEQYVDTMEKKVAALTEKAEKALRDLIDYNDELAMQESIFRGVSENIANAPAPRRGVRRRDLNLDEDEDEDQENDVDIDEDEAPASDPSILSPVELLKKAKEDYAVSYASKSMRARYDVNDYRQFKRSVHDALHPGSGAPPVPHASTWFPKESNQQSTGRPMRTKNVGNNSDDDDDDVVIAGATTNLKCPLTLQLFKEPYSNKVCKHTFEKSAILGYHSENAAAFVQSSQRGRGQNRAVHGPRQVKCPELGCEAMLSLDDFYEDQLLLRQVKRATKQAAREIEEEDEGDEYIGPRGTQRDRPEQIDDESDVQMDSNESRRQTIARVKKEHQSRASSMAARRAGASSSEPDEYDNEAMGSPEPDEDEA